MIIIKYASILLLLIISSFIGILYSKKYSGRVNNLIEMKNALILFKNKIKFTFEPVPEVFKEISKVVTPSISKIFVVASKYMDNENATDAWNKSIEENKSYTNFSDEDVLILHNFSKMLGNTDINGQINNVDLINGLLDQQIEKAMLEQGKNEKLYKTLGTSIGLTIAIILA